MAYLPAPSRRSDCHSPGAFFASRPVTSHRRKWTRSKSPQLAFAIAALLLALATPFLLRAQGTVPRITAVTPGAGKTDDSITITGQNLGKDKVAAVFLSDAKLDHKVVVVDQEATKIVIKVPALKPGDYNVSVQEGAAIYIQPVIFTVKS
jgi:IPT/TIG domain